MSGFDKPSPFKGYIQACFQPESPHVGCYIKGRAVRIVGQSALNDFTLLG